MKTLINFAITVVLGLLLWAVWQVAKPKTSLPKTYPLGDKVEIYIFPDTTKEILPYDSMRVQITNSQYPPMTRAEAYRELDLRGYRFVGHHYKTMSIEMWTKKLESNNGRQN